jgi:hypothetical protein
MVLRDIVAALPSIRRFFFQKRQMKEIKEKKTNASTAGGHSKNTDGGLCLDRKCIGLPGCTNDAA